MATCWKSLSTETRRAAHTPSGKVNRGINLAINPRMLAASVRWLRHFSLLWLSFYTVCESSSMPPPSLTAGNTHTYTHAHTHAHSESRAFAVINSRIIFLKITYVPLLIILFIIFSAIKPDLSLLLIMTQFTDYYKRPVSYDTPFISLQKKQKTTHNQNIKQTKVEYCS